VNIAPPLSIISAVADDSTGVNAAGGRFGSAASGSFASSAKVNTLPTFCVLMAIFV